MIFYNYESYFGKRKKERNNDDDEVKPMGPDASVKFDYGKYMWLLMVEKLCKELNYKPEEAYKLTYITALNWLSMWHLRDKVIKEQQKNKK